jgi:hypothetical protein
MPEATRLFQLAAGGDLNAGIFPLDGPAGKFGHGIEASRVIKEKRLKGGCSNPSARVSLVLEA